MSAYIGGIFNSSINLDPPQILWPDELADGNMLPISTSKSGVGTASSGGIVHEIAYLGFGQGKLAGASRGRWHTT